MEQESLEGDALDDLLLNITSTGPAATTPAAAGAGTAGAGTGAGAS
jgi:ribosomal protein L12E/L44/L45/RPP1/RPP2